MTETLYAQASFASSTNKSFVSLGINMTVCQVRVSLAIQNLVEERKNKPIPFHRIVYYDQEPRSQLAEVQGGYWSSKFHEREKQKKARVR